MRAQLSFESGGGTGVLTPPRPRTRQRQPGHGSGDGREPPDDGDGDGDGYGGFGGGGDGDPEPPDDESSRSDRETRARIAELGMELGLVSIASLFLVFLGAFVFMHGQTTDWSMESGPPSGLILSTLVLLASSVSLARAVLAAQRLNREQALRRVGATLTLGLLFLAIQVWLWFQMSERGELPSSGGYQAVFFTLTGLHAAHILGGLAFLATLFARMLRSEPDGMDQADPLRLCARYWHFMGVIWLVLFAVLYFPL